MRDPERVFDREWHGSAGSIGRHGEEPGRMCGSKGQVEGRWEGKPGLRGSTVVQLVQCDGKD